MHILSDPFFIQKAGNTENEYEDAFWPRKRIDQKASLFRLAVADGATETSFSGLWARLLVRAYCKGEFSPGSWSRNFCRLRKQWLYQCANKPLPWYTETKLKQGAYSSLLGLTLKAEGDGREGYWHALAIGDSCVFQVRGDSVLAKFPLDRSEQFNNRPILLGSTSGTTEVSFAAFQATSSRWEAGDSFYLMTDAVAAWFLKGVELGGTSWQIIRDLSTDSADFADWVSALRFKGELRNDDVTLVRIDTAY
ncbi:MAG: protein phosphatase 2C domain-containing protein [Candidatus Binatus sp.]|uniref:protein phosphatase 2C domain-containing protein n=1 Tax=Candidatus Binatus sp. TaxID=2811406 RepID=UPI003C78C63D